MARGIDNFPDHMIPQVYGISPLDNQINLKTVIFRGGRYVINFGLCSHELCNAQVHQKEFVVQLSGIQYFRPGSAGDEF